MPSPATSAAQQTPETHLRALCARGWDIFPCKPIRGRKDWDKHPYTTNGHKDATSDIDTVLRWWRRWPDALIGYVPASGGHIVVDCMPGIDLADLPVEWLESRIVRTPSGSLHVYFAAQEGVEYAEGPRADLKALWPAQHE